MAGAFTGVTSLVALLVACRAPSGPEISTALTHTIIPQLALHESSLSDSAAIVLQHLRRVHPELRSVRFVLYLPPEAFVSPEAAKQFDPRITVTLYNLPADQALQYIASLANISWAARDGTVYFYGPTSSIDFAPELTFRDHLSSAANSIYWRVRDTINPQ